MLFLKVSVSENFGKSLTGKLCLNFLIQLKSDWGWNWKSKEARVAGPDWAFLFLLRHLYGLGFLIAWQPQGSQPAYSAAAGSKTEYSSKQWIDSQVKQRHMCTFYCYKRVSSLPKYRGRRSRFHLLMRVCQRSRRACGVQGIIKALLLKVTGINQERIHTVLDIKIPSHAGS